MPFILGSSTFRGGCLIPPPLCVTTSSLALSVQHECIPQAILGMDVLCQAKSGMGKTAVFVLATLQQIEPLDGQVCNMEYSSVIVMIIMVLLGSWMSKGIR